MFTERLTMGLASTANILNSYVRFSNKLLLEVLDLLQQFLKVFGNQERASVDASIPTNNSNDDSQDYGDWSCVEELAIQDEAKQAAEVCY
jgi:hypothetical protein